MCFPEVCTDFALHSVPHSLVVIAAMGQCVGGPKSETRVKTDSEESTSSKTLRRRNQPTKSRRDRVGVEDRAGAIEDQKNDNEEIS